jgi:hypothetical protein
MLAGFAFEGYFFLSKKLFHGTRNIIGQIVNNMNFKQKLYFENNDFKSNTEEDKIKGPVAKKEIRFAAEILRNHFTNLGINQREEISIGYKAVIENKGIKLIK